MPGPKTLPLLIVALAAALAASADTPKSDDSERKPEREERRARVFVPTSDSWSLGSEFDLDFDGGFDFKGGAKPQTAEIVKTIHERCPDVIVTRKEERADYVLVLEHEGGKVFIRKDNKYALFNADGDAITSGSTRSLGNAVKEACFAMRSDWRHATR